MSPAVLPGAASAAASTAAPIASMHVVLVDEAHLGVELHELVLAVGAQVLVAQAAGDLVVAVDAGDHQQLLEQLRALRQGVERAGLLAAGHEELAAPSGVRRHEHRRLDLDEALGLHRRADRRVDRGSDAQVALHPLAADVEVAVLQPRGLGDRVGTLVDRERRRLGGAEDLDVAVPQLDPRRSAGRSLTCSSAGGATMPVTRTTYSRRDVDGVVDDALRDAGVVAQVDERQLLTVLATGGHPAAQADRSDRCARNGVRRTGGCAWLVALMDASASR